MTYDLAFLHVELGDPWWRTAVTEMLRSVKRVMPDARIVQLTDSETPIHPWAHESLRANIKCTPDILSKFKAYMVAQHVANTPHNVIVCDADVIWLAEPPMFKNGACAWDETADAMPWRQFYLQSGEANGRSREWLTNHVPQILDALPPVTYANDAAELLLNYNIPLSHGGPAEVRSTDSQKYLMHFSGAREEMIAFARSLDGGEQFKEMDPSYVPPPPEPPKSGVNEDLTSINFGGECPSCQTALGKDGLCGNLVCQDYKKRD